MPATNIRIVGKILGIFGLITGGGSPARALGSSSVLGHYQGYLRHSSLGVAQRMQVDLLAVREKSSELQMSAILKLEFGDAHTGEYISYHFDHVSYHLLTGALVFEQSDQNVMLQVETFGQGQMKGRLISSFSGEVGSFSLSQTLYDWPAPPLPLMESLSGEYRGNCEGGQEGVLRLHAFRSNEDTFQVGHAFGPYQIVGTLGFRDPETCLNWEDAQSERTCVVSDLNATAYNFFQGHLVLVGKRGHLECRVLPRGEWDCGRCHFKKSAVLTPPTLYPTTQPYFSLPPRATLQGELGGEYFGYLHLEDRHVFQRLRLQLVTYNEMRPEGGSRLMVAPVANLYFGDFRSPFQRTYRFESQELPPPVAPFQLLLKRAAADVDATLRIQSVSQGVIRGEWFSQMYGRVGTFEVRRSGLPTLKANVPVAEDFGGYYQAPEWEMNLVMSLGRTPVNSNNPFDPLKIAGYFRAPRLTGKMPFVLSSYDFYTGRIALSYGEGSFLLLKWAAPGHMKVYRMSNVYGSALPPFEYEDFRMPIGGPQ